MTNPRPELFPGDHLIYGRHKGWDPFSWVTQIKTWSPAVHIEVYAGDGRSFASRNGLGVALYPWRADQLIAILRPLNKFDMDSARRWFYEVANGEGYDWLGLLCFTYAVSQGDPTKMFCSEFATRFGRMGGVDAVHRDFDADKVAPAAFLMSPSFDHVWRYLRQ